MRMMSTVRGLNDNGGKPLMFGITFDGTLAAVGPAFGDAEAVRVERPEPALPFAHAVAGSQNRKGEIWLAASFGTDADSASSLYVCGPLSNDPAGWLSRDGGGPGVARFKWTPKRAGGEKTHIPEIQVGTDDDDQGPPMILISTTLKTGKVPRYERLSAAPGDDGAEQFPKFEDATELLDVVLASRPKGRGAYALYRVGTGVTRRLEFAGVPDPEYHVPTAPFTLTTPPGAMSLKTEVDEDGYTDLIVRGNGVFRFSSDKQTSYAQGEPIAADAMSVARVTSRSVLTDDYGHNEQGVFGARKAFRSTITVPADTCQVQVWATEATPAEVDGTAVTLDPVKALRVAPSAVSRITVSLPAKGITCPTLMIRTDEMNYHQRLYIFPDVGLHRTIAELPAGSLFEARERLGIGGMNEHSAEGVQKVLQNLTRSIQYTHNRTDYGVHHDRTVYANNMRDAHFTLSAGGGEPAYQELSRPEASSAVNGPDAPVTFNDLKSALGNLESVTITTLEKLGGDVVYTMGRVGEDLQQMLFRMGDHLVQGDLFGVVSDFLQGGENIGMDLFRGAANVFGDVIEGEARILFAVVKLGGRTLKFVLQNTGDVGKLLLWLLEKIGVGVEKLVAFLAKTIGWDDILKTHDVVKDMINRDLDMLADRVGDIRERGAAALQTAKQNMSAVLDGAILPLGGVPARNQTLSNEFFEASEWLAHSLASNPVRVRELDNPSSLSPLQDGYALIERVMNEHLRGGGQEVITALNAAGIDFEKFRRNKDNPDILLAGMLEIVKALGTIAFEVVGAVWDVLMGMLELFLRAVKRILNEELNVPLLSDFYSFITKGGNEEGKRLSLLSVTSLLIAIPATPIYRLMVKEAPFAGVKFAMRLDPMSHAGVVAGSISCAAQLAMALTNIPLSISTMFKIRDVDKLGTAGPGLLVVMGVIDFTLSITSNIYSTVVGYQHTTKDSFWDHHDAVTAPAAMGRILLDYSFVPICVGGLATFGSFVRLKDPVPGDRAQTATDLCKVLRSLTSVGQFVLAGMQQDLEYKKKALLNKLPEVFWSGKPGTDEETILRNGLIQIVDVGLSGPERTKANQKINSASLEVLRDNRNILKNYHAWAGNGGIAEKGYAIFMGIFPQTAQCLITYSAGQVSDGLLPFVGAGVNNHCRLAGGFTALGRTLKNAML